MGKVYLVGAGPGNIEYLTIRAQPLLEQPEVLIYDALVDERLLTLVPPNCIKFDMGKRGGRPSAPQSEINQLMVEQCRQGKQVVRLKSGDPFIFGRATSEILALQEANCPFEVVPGISSALAAPLLAGIPLTDTVLSRGFAVVSAHEPDELDWEALARLETLVILMGGRHLGEIVKQLQRYGRSHSSPIAVIRDCGRPEQQVWAGTLKDIVKQTTGISLSPAVIVIGAVVGLRDYLRSPCEQQAPALRKQQALSPQEEVSREKLKVERLKVESSPQINLEQLPEKASPPINLEQLPEKASPPINLEQLPVETSPQINLEQLPEKASPQINLEQLPVEASPENLQPANVQPVTPSTLHPSNLEPSNLHPSNLEPSNLQPANLQPSNLEPSNLEPSN